MLSIQHNSSNGKDIVKLSGRLGVADATSAMDEFNRVIESNASHLYIDMSSLEFIDSSGLSVLVSTQKKIRKAGGDITLINVNSRIRSLLALTRLDEIFDIQDDQDLIARSA